MRLTRLTLPLLSATLLTALTGCGGSPSTPQTPVLAVLDQTALSFGNVQIGTNSTIKTVTVTNISNSALTVGTPLGNDSNYVISANNCTSPVPAAGTCTFSVTFTPTTGGVNASAAISVATTGGTTLNLPISGNGWLITGFTGPTGLNYYRYGSFTVTGSGLLGLGMTLGDSTGQKCTSSLTIPGTTATDSSISLGCQVMATGSLIVDLRDSVGTVLRSSGTYTVPEPKVSITTSMGNMVVQLNPTAAPVTVKNFMHYATYKDTNNPTGYYTNTIFHRVVKNFMIQGGGFTTGPTGLVQKGTFPAIALESNNGLKNLRGTIAMARLSAPDTATSQFFINHATNTNLDYNSAVTTPNGYAVFGMIVAGDTASLAALDAIAAVPVSGTQSASVCNSPNPSCPVTDVTITSVTQTQ